MATEPVTARFDVVSITGRVVTRLGTGGERVHADGVARFATDGLPTAGRGSVVTIRSFSGAVRVDSTPTPVGLPVSGTAVGVVNGERRASAMQLESTTRPGVYALRNQWGDVGEWTLILTVTQAKDDAAQAMVKVSAGAIIAVDVPTRAGRDGSRTMAVPRRFTPAEIDALLRGRGSR